MADHTHIEWTDATWNVVTGCSVVSPGCTNCYAMRLAGTRLRHHPSRAGLTVDSRAGPVWNGQVRFNEAWLTQPLRWRRPRRIFVAAHGDLFHRGVEMHQLDRIFAIMALSPQHTFQVLTKRADEMRAYFLSWSEDPAEIWRTRARVQKAMYEWDRDASLREWPLPNVWLGVSVEDQARANERIPLLLDTPAAVRWISAEPLLGPIDLTRCGRNAAGLQGDALRWPGMSGPSRSHGARLDWVVAGGESGPGARAMHPDWARQLRDQCAAAGIPFLFKQWGDWGEFGHDHDGPLVHEVDVGSEEAELVLAAVPADRRCFVSAAGDVFHGHPDNLPEGQPYRLMERVGKRAAGRLLDGQLHDAYPEARS